MPDMPTENVQDYPRPPALVPVQHRLRVIFGGDTVADTTRALAVLETHHAPTYYIPPSDITARVTPAQGTTFCEWKGVATYVDVHAGGQTARRAAWRYAAPTALFQPLAGYLSFYASLMDACFVGEERVIAQPGDFYGGWVTSNLRGQIKGARGTEHW